MELRNVEAFLTLSEELHFGNTARRLNLTQGRVSQLIRSLENDVGAPLFDRSTRRVALTTLGQQFLDGVRQPYAAMLETLHSCRVRATGVGDVMRVGYLPSIGLDLVSQALEIFHATHPECEVIFRAVTVRVFFDLDNPVSDPDVDLALLWCPGGNGDALRSPGFQVGPALASERRALLLPVDHALARRESVSLEDIVDEVLLDPGRLVNLRMRELWTPRVTPSGRRLRMSTSDIPTIVGTNDIILDDVLTLVLSGRGLHCTVISALDRISAPGLVVIPITDMPPMVVVPMWRKDSENGKIRSFVEAVSRFAAREI